MGLANAGGAMVHSGVAGELQASLLQFLAKLDQAVIVAAQAARLTAANVPMLRPVQFCAAFGAAEIIIVGTHRDAGGMPRQFFVDIGSRPFTVELAMAQAHHELGFEELFGFQIPRSILGATEEAQSGFARGMADDIMKAVKADMEREAGIVRINPIFQGRDFQVDPRLVFALTPFSAPFNEIFDDHIKPTVERSGDFVCQRADNIYDNRAIIEDIWSHINRARVVIAELTGKNPNVFYETGVAHTVGKEVILLTQTMDDVPFDLRHLRCIVYEYTPRGIQNLEKNLAATVTAIAGRV